MKIKYEMLKKFDDFEIYRNIDEFYKMEFEGIINNYEYNEINDLKFLNENIKKMINSYEYFKKQIKKNNIENYIVICDYEHENLYLCENTINDVIMYYVNNNFYCVFNDDFKIQYVENENEKNRIIKSLFINLIYDIL